MNTDIKYVPCKVRDCKEQAEIKYEPTEGASKGSKTIRIKGTCPNGHTEKYEITIEIT